MSTGQASGAPSVVNVCPPNVLFERTSSLLARGCVRCSSTAASHGCTVRVGLHSCLEVKASAALSCQLSKHGRQLPKWGPYLAMPLFILYCHCTFLALGSAADIEIEWHTSSRSAICDA